MRNALVKGLVAGLAVLACSCVVSRIALMDVLTSMVIEEVDFVVTVVDEAGDPVPGATVDGYVFNELSRNTGIHHLDGTTAADGSVRLTGVGYYHAKATIEKDGYYETVFELGLGDPEVADRTGKWPVEDRTYVLREKQNPVAMYVRQDEFDLPGIDRPYGYDLVQADWVAPHGDGVTSHMLMTGRMTYQSWRDYTTTLTLSFPFEGAGIQERPDLLRRDTEGLSWFRTPYEAPSEGYCSSLTVRFVSSEDPAKNYVPFHRDPNLYFFRVRAAERGAYLYGKMVGTITCGTDGQIVAGEMTYYLNPDGSRNMEWDEEQNLFTERELGTEWSRFRP